MKSYEAYVKRGGTRRPRDCIDTDVLEALSLLGIDVESSGSKSEDLAADDDRFLKERSAVHVAPSEDSARAALSAISLRGLHYRGRLLVHARVHEGGDATHQGGQAGRRCGARHLPGQHGTEAHAQVSERRLACDMEGGNKRPRAMGVRAQGEGEGGQAALEGLG